MNANTSKMNTKASTSITIDADLLAQVRKEAKAENRTLSNYIETVLYRMGYRPYNEETLEACHEVKQGEGLSEIDPTSLDTFIATAFDEED